MSTRVGLPIIFEPTLVEEVVLRTIGGHPDQRNFRRERNRLYLIADWDVREQTFQKFHTSWFERLGFGHPIHVALRELPILAHTCTRCVVASAATRHDEGADLLVTTNIAGADERTVLIRVRPPTFDDAEEFLALLRTELLHVADMVDPAFGYEPKLPSTDGGPTCERLLRDRYRSLWNVSVAGRLVRRAVAPAGARESAQLAFAAAFPMLGAATDTAFARFFDGFALTHAELLAFATAPRLQQAGGAFPPGGRCPLCRFPTYAPEPAPEQLPGAVIERIVGDFPDWHATDGLCSQCADLYRARPLSASAAQVLPGR